MANFNHRKSSQRVQLVNTAGVPLANTKVQATLKNHEFLFGCGAFDSLPATAQEDMGKVNFYQDNIVTSKGFYQDRMDKWLKVYNYGTIPFYWAGYEPEEGNVLFDSRMNAAKYLQEHNVKVKGHPLCWHTVCADWLMEYDNATILQKQLDRIHRDVSAFRGVVDMWDVINEVCIMPVFDRYDNAITRICKDLGRIRLVKEVFEAARAANPDATLLINDFNITESYRILIDGILNAGIKIDAIGIQTHQHQGYLGREKLEEVLERYSCFGVPIHFTENTLISGDLMPPHIVDLNDYQVDVWPTTPEGEERQRKEWREMYEILFAHPSIEAVTGWDFADGAWLHAPSGVIREDNTPKPAYYELQNLIHNEWTTDETLMTDANGFVTIDGFRGTYDITAAGKKAEFVLAKNGAENTKVVL